MSFSSFSKWGSLIVAMASLVSNVNGQPVREVTASENVQIAVGQTRTFLFEEAVVDFRLAASGIAEVLPLTDRTYTIRGLSPGTVLGIAYGEKNKVVHSMNFEVSPEHVTVKIYGDKLGVKGFASYYCVNGGGCSRANPDVVRLPDQVKQSETHQTGNGSSETVERVYDNR